MRSFIIRFFILLGLTFPVLASAANVALSSAGATVSVTSQYSAAYPADAIINGDITGAGWGAGGGWNDGTIGAFPDTATVTFNGTKTIDHVVVYSVQDNYASPSQPTDVMTFTTYGIADFTVEGFNGASWVSLGTVTGNNLVKRTVTFAPVAVSAIRVNVNASAGANDYSRIVEIEAYTVPLVGYSLAALSGQNGWDGGTAWQSFSSSSTVTNAASFTGLQSWLYSGSSSSPGAGTPFTPDVATVGALNGTSAYPNTTLLTEPLGNESIVKFAFRAVAPGDGSRINLHEGKITRDDRTGASLWLENTNSPNGGDITNPAGTVALYNAEYDGSAYPNCGFTWNYLGYVSDNSWHTVEMTTEYPDVILGNAATFGTTTYVIDKGTGHQQTATSTSWAHPWFDCMNVDPSYTANPYIPGASLKWASSYDDSPVHKGFFIDDVSMTVNNTIAHTTVGSLFTSFEAAPSITTSSLPHAMVGHAYSQSLAATGTPPYTWSSDPLPAGLNLNPNTGVISGIPTAAGTVNFNVSATDAVNLAANSSLSIDVVAALAISTSSLPDATGGATYSATLAATGGTAPYIWSGTMPAGLNLDANTGHISGIPASGAHVFTVTVTDADGFHVQKIFTLNVSAAVDLSVSALSSTADGHSLNVGDTITIHDTVTNAGPDATTTSRISIYYYLASDPNNTTGDRLLVERSITGQLGAGAIDNGTTTATIPLNLPAGTYYIREFVDANNSQLEYHEDNNTRVTSSFTVLPVAAGVDLRVSALSSTADGGNVNVGDTITIHDTVQNGGSLATTASRISMSFYLSLDQNITTADTLLVQRSITTHLAAGGSDNGTTTVAIPLTLAPGTYYIGEIVDPNNAQAESNETNNTLATVSSFTVVRNVDLSFTAFSSTVGGSIIRGGSFTINDTVHNGGSTTTTVSNLPVRFYVSADANITTADKLIGSRNLPGLMAAGASSSAATTATIPSTLAPGTYYIGGIVDPSNSQPETVETNNVSLTLGPVTVY